MEKVYELYIRTTPVRLWEAITDPEIRGRFHFGNRITSEWTPGSRFEMGAPGAPGLLGEGLNLEVDPPRRLVQSMVAQWIEEPRQVDVTSAEEAGEDRVLPGRGALAGLERARVYPPVWPTAAALYRASSSSNNGAGAKTLDVTKPSGAAAGDVVLIVVTCTGKTPAGLAGWVRIRDATEGTLRQTAFRKRLVSGEPVSWRFTWSASTAAIGQAVALQNATADETQYGMADTSGSGTTIELPSINVGVIDGILLTFAAVGYATSVAPPAGFTEAADVSSSSMTAEIAYKTAPALGDTGDLTATAGHTGSWIGAQLYVPSTGSADAIFAGATFGGVLKTLIDEAQARGALPWLTYDFDGSVDSSNAPWTDTFDLSFHVGTSLLDVFRHLASLGMEGRISPTLKLSVYADASRHFEGSVIFRKGRHFTGNVERASHTSTYATRVLVEGGGGRIVEVALPALEADLRIGRREGYVSMTTSDDATTIQRAGELALELADLETRAIDVDVAHGARIDGHFEPWIDYRPGDYIGIDTTGSGTIDVHRVAAIKLERTEDGYDVNLDLNSVQLELALRLQRKVDAIAGGGGMSASFGGSSSGSSAASRLVAARPGDKPGYLGDKIETGTALTKEVVGEIGSQRVRLSAVITPASLGTGTPDSSTFLRGDGTWAAPAGGGSGIVVMGALPGLAASVFSGGQTNYGGVVGVYAETAAGMPNYHSSGTRPLYGGSDSWGIVWTGEFVCPATGTWTFWTYSDDGSDLAISSNGGSSWTTVVSNNLGGGQGDTGASGTISLTSGSSYRLRVRWGQGGGGWDIRAYWQAPGSAQAFLTDASGSVAPPWSPSGIVTVIGAKRLDVVELLVGGTVVASATASASGPDLSLVYGSLPATTAVRWKNGAGTVIATETGTISSGMAVRLG